VTGCEQEGGSDGRLRAGAPRGLSRGTEHAHVADLRSLSSGLSSSDGHASAMELVKARGRSFIEGVDTPEVRAGESAGHFLPLEPPVQGWAKDGKSSEWTPTLSEDALIAWEISLNLSLGRHLEQLLRPSRTESELGMPGPRDLLLPTRDAALQLCQPQLLGRH
jgi:hypothetical protein